MNKRTQKRYSTEQEILDAIESLKAKAKALEAEAEEVDKLKLNAIKMISEASEQDQAATAEYWRDEMKNYERKAASLRTRSNNITNKRLHEMKDILAAFRTEIMPFMGMDNSVVA